MAPGESGFGACTAGFCFVVTMSSHKTCCRWCRVGFLSCCMESIPGDPQGRMRSDETYVWCQMQIQRSCPGFSMSYLCPFHHGKSSILPSSGPEIGPVSRHFVPSVLKLCPVQLLSPSGCLSLYFWLCFSWRCVQAHTWSPFSLPWARGSC